MYVLKIENLKKYYGVNTNITKAVNGISFNVNKGEFVAIMGASGSGKTTLLHCISTIDAPTSGFIAIGNKDITKIKEDELADFRKENLGFIFQDFNLLDTMTIEENIALSLIINKEDVKEIDKKVVTIETSRMLLETMEQMNTDLKATILMVTHDSFSASFCNRVLFLKDGKIFNEIIKGEKTRKKFFNEIIDMLTLLGGDVDNVI